MNSIRPDFIRIVSCDGHANSTGQRNSERGRRTPRQLRNTSVAARLWRYAVSSTSQSGLRVLAKVSIVALQQARITISDWFQYLGKPREALFSRHRHRPVPGTLIVVQALERLSERHFAVRELLAVQIHV